MIVPKTTCLLSVFIWLSTSLVLVRCEGKPRFKVKVKTRYNVEVGSSVKLGCPVTGTNDPLENRTLVVWKYGSRVINNNDRKWSRFRVKAGKYLKIVIVNQTDAGVYTCEAYNEFGSIKTNITLSIKRPRKSTGGKPPKFKISPKRRVMSFKNGETAKLKCHSTGDPDPDIQWFKDGQSYGQHKRTSVSPSGWTLNLRYLTVQDSGTYLCRVSNSLGTINRTFTVMVKERIHKPVIDEPLTKQVTVRQGLNAKLECKAWSVGIPEFTWKRWDIELNSWQGLQGSKRVCMTHESYKTRSAIPDQSQHGAILLIRNVTKMDEGNYSCVVKNKHGTDEMEMSLCVLDKDDTPDFTTPSMASSNNGLQTTETSVPLILVVGLTASIVVTVVFIIVLILCCRQQRKHLEKQYVMEYKPAEILQYQRQTSVSQEMEKVVQQDVNPGGLWRREFWNQPYSSPVRTSTVTERPHTFFATGIEEQCSQNYLRNQKYPERTNESRSSRIEDLNLVNSPTPSLGTLPGYNRTDRKPSVDSKRNIDYSQHHGPPPEYTSVCHSASCYDTPTNCKVSHQYGSHHSRESIV